jgi:hypothetical protein
MFGGTSIVLELKQDMPKFQLTISVDLRISPAHSRLIMTLRSLRRPGGGRRATVHIPGKHRSSSGEYVSKQADDASAKQDVSRTRPAQKGHTDSPRAPQC